MNIHELERAPSHFEEIQRTISEYRGAIKGDWDIHYWLDVHGAIQHTLTTEKGLTEAPALPEEYTDEFVGSLGITYAGTMSAGLLEQRINDLSRGNGIL